MEIEVKFVIPDKATCKRLQEAKQLAGFVLSPGHSKKIHDTYLDTAEQAVKNAGYACRKREHNGTILITLKQLEAADGAVHRREEFEISLPADLPPAQWPDCPARELALRLIHREPLVALFDLSQTRFVRLLSSHSGRLVAELSIDEVQVAKRTYLELEAELLQEGTESDLAKIQNCLLHEWGLRPESRSKFERALTLISADTKKASAAAALAVRSSVASSMGRKLAAVNDHYGLPVMRANDQSTPAKKLSVHRPDHPGKKTAHATAKKKPRNPGLKIDDTMAEGARKTLSFHFKRMLQHEPGTRSGEDIEELHDMRVATRRMRAAVRVFGDYLDTQELKPFAKDLRRVGRALGAVRDLDVFQQKTRAYIDTLPPDRKNELEPLLSVLREEHQKAREQMLSFLNSGRYSRFKKRFNKFLKKPGAAALPAFAKQGEPLPQRIQHVLPIVLYQRVAAVRAYDTWIEAPDVPLERLHLLRIAFKRLRYTLEFFREVLHPAAEQLIDEIKGLQDHLGDLQDAVVTCTILRDFLNWGTWGHSGSTKNLPHFKPVIAPGVVSYLSARQVELQRLVETFPAIWGPKQQAGFVKTIAELIHKL